MYDKDPTLLLNKSSDMHCAIGILLNITDWRNEAFWILLKRSYFRMKIVDNWWKRFLWNILKYQKIVVESVGMECWLKQSGCIRSLEPTIFHSLFHTQIEQTRFQSLRNSLPCEWKGLSFSMICACATGKGTEIVFIRFKNKSKPFRRTKLIIPSTGKWAFRLTRRAQSKKSVNNI